MLRCHAYMVSRSRYARWCTVDTKCVVIMSVVGSRKGSIVPSTGRFIPAPPEQAASSRQSAPIQSVHGAQETDI